MEQKYKIGNEYGSIMWDVEKIINDKKHFEIREYNVKELALSNPFFGDYKYAVQTDITQPLILVQLTENIDKLIDGNHRLQKALKAGIETIAAYRLSFAEHHNYIVDYDEEVYRKVVEHWKS